MRRRPFLLLAVVGSAFASPFAVASCGGGDVGGGTSAMTGGGGSGGATNSSTTSLVTASSGSSMCTDGMACGDGGVCTSGTCCPAARACGDACCASAEVCSFQKCETPGAACHDSTDCAANEYCETALGDNDGGAPDSGAPGCMGGVALPNGKCLPKPPTCAPDAGTPDGGALDCLEECDYHPTGTFSPTLAYQWGGEINSPFSTDVMMAPIVIELDDDNCDGKVNENDIPEILFTSFSNGDYGHNGVLHAISIVGGQVVEKWSYPGINPSGQLAGGDIDGVPGNEIVACTDSGNMIALKADGTLLWQSTSSCYMPSIADMDGDGHPEIVDVSGIVDGATGALKVPISPGGLVVVSDVDNDGKLDVVSSFAAWKNDGTLLASVTLPSDGNAGVGDFDLDGVPEIVDVDAPTHSLALWHIVNGVGVVVRPPVDMNALFATNHCPVGSAGYTSGGGPPTVADFNGDGYPDVGIAGGIGYVVFDGKKLMDPSVAGPDTILWSAVTTDCSSAQTGSSVFDFDGDGKAEVVYSDENHLRIYDGTNGNVLFTACNTTGTLIEYPVIADVDNDGHADIVVVSNAYASPGDPEYECDDGMNIAQSGVHVFEDANATWVRTRRVWNEHAYHITNVNEDGTIPKNEPPNITQPGLNNFRQNKQPGSEFSAPDAVVGVSVRCPGPSAIVATVRNIGQAALPAGVVIGFYEGAVGSGTLLGQMSTTTTLYPAEAEEVVFPIMNPDMGLSNGTTPVYAVADDGMPMHPSWHECRTDNNTSEAVKFVCNGPK